MNGQQQVPPQMPYYEDEIDLYELFMVLVKRKNIILLTTLVFTVSALLFVFISPPKYKVSIIVKPTVLKFSEFGKLITEVNTNDVKNWIDSNYEKLLYKKFGEDFPKIQTSTKRGSGLLEVYSYCSNISKCKEALMFIIEKFSENIINNPQSLVNSVKKEIQIEIAKKSSNIELNREKIKVLSKKKATILNYINSTNQTIKNLKIKSDFITKNTEQMISKRSRMIGKTDTQTMLVLSSIIQDNLVFVSNLYLKISELKKEILKKEDEIEQIDQKIAELRQNIKIISDEIKILKHKLQHLLPIEVVQSITSSPKPVKPKKKLIVAVAFVSGLFMGIFLAFFAEYIENARKRYQEEAK